MQTNADWRGTACLLRAGFQASLAGHVGALLAGWGLLQRHAEPAFLVALAAWAYLVYLQVRVSLDAELFGWLAGGGEVDEMDGFLVRAGLIPAGRARTAPDRCRGALRLWRQLLAVLALELVAVAVGLR